MKKIKLYFKPCERGFFKFAKFVVFCIILKNFKSNLICEWKTKIDLKI